MKIIKEKFKKDERNRLYWGRIYFISDSREWRIKLLWSMTFEFVRRQLLAETWKDEDVDRIINKVVVQKEKEAGKKIFHDKVRFAAYGIDDKEKAELGLYLQERDRMDRHG